MKTFFTFLQLLLLANVFSQNLEDDLLLYYPFDGNFNDLSGNGFNATNFGAVLGEDRFGNPNSACHFDGVDDFINLPNIADLKPALPVSFSFWIKYETTGYRPVFNTSFEEDKSSGVYFNSNSMGNYSVSFGDGSNFYASSTRSTFISEANAARDEWHLIIVVVESSGQMKIFEDCKEYGGTYSGTGGDLQYSTTAGSIGRHDRNTNTLADFFEGIIDEFRYWNRALNDEDIIELNKIKTFNLGPDITSCNDTIIKLIAPTAENLSYEWNTGESTSEINVTTSGQYILNLIQGVCQSPDTVNITIQESPEVNLGNDLTFCMDTSIILQVIENENLIYEWSTEENTAQITVNSSGVYILKITDGFCENSDTINISIDNTTSLNLGEDLILCGDTSILLSGYLGNNFSYQWNTGETNSDILVKNSGNYILQATNENCSLTDTVSININTLTPLDLGEDLTFCSLNNIPVELEAGDKFIEYYWNNGSVNSSITISDVGTYSVVAVDANGCKNSDSVEITNECAETIFVPTAFSPNSDGINDIFKPKGSIKEGSYSLKIYNRYAEKVFETFNFETGWDGIFRKAKQPVGVYVWVIEYSNSSDENKLLNGNVTLLR